MRVLILSVTAGYGHISAANAISAELSRRGSEVVVEDLYQYASQVLHDLIENGYLFSVKHLKKPYHHAYSSLERSERMRRMVSVLTANRLIARRFATYFEGYTPDIIVTTHVFGAQVLDILKSHGFLNIPVIGIVTDYCFHPFWEDLKKIEYIVTGSERMLGAAIRRGIPADKLLPFGIPVRSAFQSRTPKKEAREKLGLKTDSKTVLIMGGSMGYGNMLQTVASIDRLCMDIQIVCICGSNDKLRRRLEHIRTHSPLTICGFVNNVDEYMDAADCVITKPGGCTVTEALCKAIPMILTEPIPGHEERNIDFLVRNCAAMRTGDDFPAAEAVYTLFSNSDLLDIYTRGVQLLSKPNAAKDICDFLFKL